MRSKEEIEAQLLELLQIISECRRNRSMLGRSEALKSSDTITATIAAAQLQTLEYVLGSLDSPMKRSKLLKDL